MQISRTAAVSKLCVKSCRSMPIYSGHCVLRPTQLLTPTRTAAVRGEVPIVRLTEAVELEWLHLFFSAGGARTFLNLNYRVVQKTGPLYIFPNI